MADEYQGNALQDPARKMWLVTPHDTTPLDPIPKALRFDGAGAVTLQAVDSGTDVVIAVVAGEIISVRAEFIRDTGTDAITIHGLG